MQSRRNGHCCMCNKPIFRGDEIDKWVYRWVHRSCRDREAASKSSERL